MTNDLTVGKPLPAILRMSLPIMAGNLFQQFYGMTDTIIVGRLLGKYALAAVGSTSSLYNMILWFANGVAGGFAIILAQKFGARRYKELRQRLALSIMLSVAISLLVTVLSLLFIGRILHVMHTPAEIYPDAERYIITVLAGLTATVAYNMAASVLRALGDSRTPLFFLIFSSLLNIGLDVLFIGPLGGERQALPGQPSWHRRFQRCSVFCTWHAGIRFFVWTGATGALFRRTRHRCSGWDFRWALWGL